MYRKCIYFSKSHNFALEIRILVHTKVLNKKYESYTVNTSAHSCSDLAIHNVTSLGCAVGISETGIGIRTTLPVALGAAALPAPPAALCTSICLWLGQLRLTLYCMWSRGSRRFSWQIKWNIKYVHDSHDSIMFPSDVNLLQGWQIETLWSVSGPNSLSWSNYCPKVLYFLLSRNYSWVRLVAHWMDSVSCNKYIVTRLR